MNIPMTQFNRRAFLRGTGAMVALPYLESLAQPLPAVAATGRQVEPMRMVCIGLEYGMHPEGFFPAETGRNYKMPDLLKPLERLRQDFTIFSHLDHPGIQGGHHAVHAFLSGIRSETSKGLPEGNITLDQKAAEFIGSNTRYPSLQLNVGGSSFGGGISWTRNGVAIPPMIDLQSVFDALFLETPESKKKRLAESYDLNSSILDVVREDARLLQQHLGKNDREKLDEYFTSVREVEKRLAMSEAWLNRPKPEVDYTLPKPLPENFHDQVPLYYDLMKLALQTDSTRILTYNIVGWEKDSGLAGVNNGYHALTHHGRDPERLKQLAIIESFHGRQLARFLENLKNIQATPDQSLLDKTMVLFGSGMGNASSHSNRDLPLLLAGGGFRHGEHRDYPKVGTKQTPACNLFVSMLQKFGMEIEHFGTSSGALEGIT
jgi:Protein of unknown function (DUF1552)